MSFEPGHDHSDGSNHDHFAEAVTGSGAGDAATDLSPQGTSLKAAELDEEIGAHDHAPTGSNDHDHAATGANLPRTVNYSQQSGTLRKDVLVGSDGNDFLFAGDGAFRFNTAFGGGGTEFPFRTDSSGTSEINAELKDGVLRIDGSFQNFDGAPLFSQGEQEIDPKARILNGSDPEALVNGFLAVPEDVEGNALSGTHLHFSPAGDSRGDFADATVIRFLENTVNSDGKSGTFKGEFELTPEEQAALVSGNLYINSHTNLDVDGDGRAGFPTGENRINLNQNVVEFA